MVRTPKYRRQHGRDFAFVEYRGERVRLPGRADSPESLEAYHKLVASIVGDPEPPKLQAFGMTISELALAWLDHCKAYYVANGKPTSEYHICRQSARILTRMVGEEFANSFGPSRFKHVRAAMIRGDWPREDDDVGHGQLTRSTINKYCNRIRRMFRWGVEQELIPSSVLEGLRAVAPLAKGRTSAKEAEPTTAVDQAVVDATLKELHQVVADMVRIQELTGMRSANICGLRPCEIVRQGPVWIYSPATHKGTWRGQTLAIPIGPRAQSILAPYLERPADKFCFSPLETTARNRSKRTRYSSASYRRAITRACERAEVPHWHPHQLRHSRGQIVREKYGVEAAQAVLGHDSLEATEIYTAKRLTLAVQVALEMG